MRISTTPTSTDSSPGFTLIELAVVIALLGLLATLAIPLFGRPEGNTLGTSARRLSGTIRALYNEAAITGKEHRLVYNLDQGSFRAEVIENSGEIVDFKGLAKGGKLASDIRFRSIEIAGRGLFSRGEVTVHIHPAGWVEETMLHLQNRASEQLSIHVLPLSGSTEHLDGYRRL